MKKSPSSTNAALYQRNQFRRFSQAVTKAIEHYFNHIIGQDATLEPSQKAEICQFLTHIVTNTPKRTDTNSTYQVAQQLAEAYRTFAEAMKGDTLTPDQAAGNAVALQHIKQLFTLIRTFQADLETETQTTKTIEQVLAEFKESIAKLDENGQQHSFKTK